MVMIIYRPDYLRWVRCTSLLEKFADGPNPTGPLRANYLKGKENWAQRSERLAYNLKG